MCYYNNLLTNNDIMDQKAQKSLPLQKKGGEVLQKRGMARGHARRHFMGAKVWVLFLHETSLSTTSGFNSTMDNVILWRKNKQVCMASNVIRLKPMGSFQSFRNKTRGPPSTPYNYNQLMINHNCLALC